MLTREARKEQQEWHETDSKVFSANKKSVDQLNQLQERQNILDWLTSVDYSTQHNDFLSRRQEGTGQWLLESEQFQKWLDQSTETLFCPGIPGAGKTIVTSIVVEHLSSKFHNDATTAVAYLYCSYKQRQEQRPVDLLASLLKQLAQQQPSLPESVKTLYEHHRDKKNHTSFNEISKTLRSTVGDYSRTFIIIDALDEYQVSNEARKEVLSEIFSLQAKTGANLFSTSRFIPEVTKEFEGSISIEIRA